ncbi:nuclear transport factor 2 family protein [Spirosoma arcticum]
MHLLDKFCRMLIGVHIATLIENLHVRLLNDWIRHPADEHLHPECTWKLADAHPHTGTYQGREFYEWYTDQLSDTYPAWIEVIDSVIGSQIGGIVVGEYQFQRETNGNWYTATFTHFYRIDDGQITSIRFFMGEVKRSTILSQPIADVGLKPCTLSLN